MFLKAALVVCAVLGLACGWLYWANGNLKEANEAQAVEIASLNRSVETLTQAAAQSRLAAEVAKAQAAREREAAAAYEALRDNFRNGGNDADLPCWFSDRINELLGRMPALGCRD